MKILAICGSPRKGNTYSALKTIQDSFPDIDFELLMLKDLHFELCKGCYACVLRGEEKCPTKDDMPADYEYYKDKKYYYYDVSIPSYKKWIAKKVVKKELDKILN